MKAIARKRHRTTHVPRKRIPSVLRTGAQIGPDDQRRVSAMDDDHAFDAASVAECESRYASFRRSDGTYQPFGRSTRQMCPLLR